MFSSEPSQPNEQPTAGAEKCGNAEHTFSRRGEVLFAPSHMPVRSCVLESLSKEEVCRILQQAKAEAAEFVARTGLTPASGAKEVSPASIQPEQMAKFEGWYAKSGREEMAKLIEALASFIRDNDLQGHPGHDRRHILIQDPMVGLGFIGSTVHGEKIEGARTLFLLPSLFHDLGRLMEPSLGRKDTCLESEVATEHASISFLYMKGFLEKHAPPSMPQELKDHLLFAVLAHARGDYPNHLFAHLTQSCDRPQIYGAEGLRRMLACDVGIKGIGIYPASAEPGHPDHPQSYGGKTHQNLLGHIEYFIRKGNPFPGRDELLKTSARIVYLMAQGTEYEQRFFEPELARDQGEPTRGSEPPLPAEIWAAATSQPAGIIAHRIESLRAEHAGRDLSALALSFVDAPGAAVLAEAKALPPHSDQTAAALLSQRIEAVPEALKANLREALLYSLAMRDLVTDAPREAFLHHSEPLVRGVAGIVAEAALRR